MGAEIGMEMPVNPRHDRGRNPSRDAIVGISQHNTCTHAALWTGTDKRGDGDNNLGALTTFFCCADYKK